MDADTPFHAVFAGNPRIALRCQLLQCHGAFDGADHRAELDQDTVAGHLDDPPAMTGYERIGDGAMLAQSRLVEPHQPAVACNIGGENGGKTAGGGHDQPSARFFVPRLARNRGRSPTLLQVIAPGL